ARQVDAADARWPQQDAALAGGRERVLVVHVRIRHAHHQLARIELVERAVDELRLDLPLDFAKAIRPELFHFPSSAQPAGTASTAFRAAGSPCAGIPPPRSWRRRPP